MLKASPRTENSLSWNRTSDVDLGFSGCYGTLGLESGSVADTQLSASSVWDWRTDSGLHMWGPSGARLKKTGLPWAPSQSDQQQWLQVDLKNEKMIAGTLCDPSQNYSVQMFSTKTLVIPKKENLD